MSQPLTSRRERLRHEAVVEIKRFAMRQLAESGAAGISITAIAKQMGMTGPALYRYFANREALLTALIRDGYADLAQTAERAAKRAAALPPAERLHVVAAAVRGWALAEPQRYLLLFGTPVPGYEAPMDTLDEATRTLNVLIAITAELASEPSRALVLATVAWTRLHGIISLELVGQFTHLDVDPESLLAGEMNSLVAQAITTV
ncbi:TetR-family transcriptional regulator [uncultured Mycobacterium sp.]|uniref:TetR-family transcriptional regulator n=1 Tax=uncultured Mycobacterium sp. TaxID=171292 RepID=A0A1Y5PF40_9MYCO|nr:TetR-family transcriptional regulator [uncultured Mycobacterium sp.]